MARDGRGGGPTTKPRRGASREALPDDSARGIADVPVEAVLDAYERSLARAAAEGRREAVKKRSFLGPLRRHLGGLRVGDVTSTREDGPGSTKRYVAARVAEKARNVLARGGVTARTVSPWTAQQELSTLRAAMREYAAHRGLVGVPKIRLEKLGAAPVVWLGRAEVARVLWALRGRRWDSATQAWQVGADGRRIVLPRKGRHVLARWVILAVYAWLDRATACRLRWAPSPDGHASFVDLDEEVDGRVGHVHRLGPDTPAGPMAGVPVATSRRLRAHLLRWREQDRGRHGFVLHRRRRGRSDDPVSLVPDTIARVFRDAGLPGDVDANVLRNSGVAWALRAGTRAVPNRKPFHRPPALMRSASFLAGLTYRTFARRYGPLSPDFQRRQAAAMNNPPATVRD